MIERREEKKELECSGLVRQKGKGELDLRQDLQVTFLDNVSNGEVADITIIILKS